MLFKLGFLLTLVGYSICISWNTCQTDFGVTTHLSISGCSSPAIFNLGQGQPCVKQRGQTINITVTYHLFSQLNGYTMSLINRNTNEIYFNEACNGCFLQSYTYYTYHFWVYFTSTYPTGVNTLQWNLIDTNGNIRVCALTDVNLV